MRESWTSQAVAALQQADDYREQAVYVNEYEPRRPRYGKLKKPIEARLKKNLEKNGIKRLYTHQVDAVSRVRRGEDVVIVTETASGKSLCYNIPVIEDIIGGGAARALYIFPTKALGQDQTRMLHQLIAPDAEYIEGKYYYSPVCGRKKIGFGAYDGDTPRDIRSAIRKQARVILTNPDMLSLGILPNHFRLWKEFFSNLKYIVLDEIHIYRGVFGSHIANVLRRMSRICEYYGSRPVFVCCSATIANPAEHASRLTGREVTGVEESGAPASGRTFVMWNPPLSDDSSGGFTRSPLAETIDLFSYFATRGKRTIVFARARPTVEVILRYTKDRMTGGGIRPESIVSYRAGYLASERRSIERALGEGDLMGVVCTNALELGVDIGSLDVAVINGFPGSIASVWQQAGRAGRRSGGSIAFFVAYNEPLDQYFMRHPEYFFGRPVEQAIINPENPYILRLHLQAAAAELPLKRSEKELFGGDFIKLVRQMIHDGDMRESRRGAFWFGQEFPASQISLRNASADRYVIMLPNGDVIGEMDGATVFQYLHDGAVYLHQGSSFIVEQLDLKDRIAHVKPKVTDYYTRSLSSENIEVDRVLKKKKLNKTRVLFGFVDVTGRVHSYKKIRRRDDAVLGWTDLDYPEEKLWTHGFWFVPPGDVIRKVQKEGGDVAGGLHALEHACISLMPFMAMCDRQDIGGVSAEMHPDTAGDPVVFIHDGCGGGIGIAETGYERVEELLKKTLELIRDCPCETGCPSCIQSPKCGNMNEPLDKNAAVMMLEGILQ